MRLLYPDSLITIRKLDLASFASIKDFAQIVKDYNTKIDILINNAGVMSSKERKETEDGYEWTVGVNYFGTILLTLLLLDIVSDKVIFLASCSHGFVERLILEDFHSTQWDETYSQSMRSYARSKASLMTFIRMFAQKVYAKKGIKVYSVDPGCSATDITRDLPMLYRKDGGFNALESMSRPFVRTPAEAASSVMSTVVSQEPYNNQTFHFCDGKSLAIGSCIQDEESSQKLWRLTKTTLNNEVLNNL
jgi:NAD(P)-dependent dehydrogenase (short-subunit alcohol dehydrogenase family)